jgi:hypothetical protein
VANSIEPHPSGELQLTNVRFGCGGTALEAVQAVQVTRHSFSLPSASALTTACPPSMLARPIAVMLVG